MYKWYVERLNAAASLEWAVEEELNNAYTGGDKYAVPVSRVFAKMIWDLDVEESSPLIPGLKKQFAVSRMDMACCPWAYNEQDPCYAFMADYLDPMEFKDVMTRIEWNTCNMESDNPFDEPAAATCDEDDPNCWYMTEMSDGAMVLLTDTELLFDETDETTSLAFGTSAEGKFYVVYYTDYGVVEVSNDKNYFMNRFGVSLEQLTAAAAGDWTGSDSEEEASEAGDAVTAGDEETAASDDPNSAVDDTANGSV
eukprot:GDKI01003491.1.p1 GENE.GDKI01003491.1~~GDKI01003491.1.p1  ORF type:complete len:253 (-),score=86.89 GDKI01003491.1:761-1519(-)